MPRDNDKNNAPPRGRRDRQTGEGRPGDKGRSGAKRGPEKKFAKRAAGGKPDGERRAYAGKSEGGRSFGVDSTPTFFINGQMQKGALSIERFSEIIDPLVAAARQ